MPCKDILGFEEISSLLTSACRDIKLTVPESAESTNTMLRKAAQDGAEHGTVIITDHQTAGRGRMGKSFFSPKGTGLYMSLLLRPESCTIEKTLRFTTSAAVAVCEALEAISEKKAAIKWVNDVYINGKKVCGILTESAVNPATGFTDYAVLGIGVNVYAPKDGFPEEIRERAGYIFDEETENGKNRLAAEILNRFMELYAINSDSDYIDKYRKRSFLTGKDVRVLLPKGAKKATVLGIDENCRLLVQYENGETEALYSGDVTLEL